MPTWSDLFRRLDFQPSYAQPSGFRFVPPRSKQERTAVAGYGRRYKVKRAAATMFAYKDYAEVTSGILNININAERQNLGLVRNLHKLGEEVPEDVARMFEVVLRMRKPSAPAINEANVHTQLYAELRTVLDAFIEQRSEGAPRLQVEFATSILTALERTIELKPDIVLAHTVEPDGVEEGKETRGIPHVMREHAIVITEVKGYRVCDDALMVAMTKFVDARGRATCHLCRDGYVSFTFDQSVLNKAQQGELDLDLIEVGLVYALKSAGYQVHYGVPPVPLTNGGMHFLAMFNRDDRAIVINRPFGKRRMGEEVSMDALGYAPPLSSIMAALALSSKRIRAPLTSPYPRQTVHGTLHDARVLDGLRELEDDADDSDFEYSIKGDSDDESAGEFSGWDEADPADQELLSANAEVEDMCGSVYGPVQTRSRTSKRRYSGTSDDDGRRRGEAKAPKRQ